MGTPMSPGVVGGEDVAEVAGGHADVDGVAGRHRAARGEVGVGAHVVDDLRQQPAPVDGVGRAQGELVPLGQLGGEVAVVEDRLDRALAVVEVAAEAEHGEVVARLRDHLQLLQRRDAGVGVVDADAGVGAIGEAVERRHAGVAAGRHQDEEVEVGGALGVRLLERLAEVQRHALQRHVLEGQRGAVPELEHVTPRSHLAHRGDLGVVEVGAVGPRRDLARLRGGDVEAEGLVDRRRPRVVRQRPPARRSRSTLNRGQPLGHEQAAARGDALEDRLGERAGRGRWRRGCRGTGSWPRDSTGTSGRALAGRVAAPRGPGTSPRPPGTTT